MQLYSRSIVFVRFAVSLSIFVTHIHGIMSVANNSYTSFMYVLQVKLFAGDVFYICRNCQYN